VYKFANPGLRLKHRSFLLKVADYCEGRILDETQEEDDVEAADEDDPSPPTTCAKKRSCWETVRRHEGAPTSGNCWSWKREISTETLKSVCGS
jgi:hypothetical protein